MCTYRGDTLHRAIGRRTHVSTVLNGDIRVASRAVQKIFIVMKRLSKLTASILPPSLE